MPNPVIAEVMRGGTVESRHTGAYVVVDRSGAVVASAGNIDRAVFPRSSAKAFQCLPVIESGAADRFGFNAEEIALACASHTGEPAHLRVARAMLAKTEMTEANYECGAHWPDNLAAHHAAARLSDLPLQIHNNCSGKHAGMLALARQLGADPKGYVGLQHPVQRAIAKAMGAICDCDLDRAPVGVDGCSVPTWAIPLRNLALGFSRLASQDHKAGRRIIDAARANPFMVAGTGEFDTLAMTAIPRLFVKGGAEGVRCGCIPHAGLGFALKCDDGATRASRVATASLLAELDVWTSEEKASLAAFRHFDLSNCRNIATGEVRAPL
jgi:L-asparaginase II